MAEREEIGVFHEPARPLLLPAKWQRWGRRYQQWRFFSGLVVVGAAMLTSVIFRGHWFGLLGVMMFVAGGAMVIRDIGRGVPKGRQDQGLSFREAARPTLIALRWFLVAIALLIGGAAITLVA
ncbi:MAG: hypothetical protein WCB57_13560 [Pseudonocardiaceae bacterium]